MDTRIALVALLCALAGAAAGWFLRPTDATTREDTAPVADERPAPAEPQPELGTEATVLKAELEGARKDLRDEMARREGAELEIARLRAQVESLRSAATKGTAPDAPTVAKGVRYPYEKYKQPLEAVDWDVAGDAIAHITPLLKELTDALAEGKPLPPSVGNIQRYNGPLVTAALTAQQGGLPGTGVNGSFTHPVMLANMIYATLLKAGKPLDEAQEKRLEGIADSFVKEDERRMAGYDESTLGLHKLIEETALKDRFFAAVDELVTDEQREILHPKSVRGRTSADLFSSAVIWGTVIRPGRFSKPEELSAVLARQIVARYRVPADQKTTVDDLCAEWIKGFPVGYLSEASDTLTLAGRHKVERVRIAAERQLVLFRALLDRLPADWAGGTEFRNEAFVLVPVRTP